MKKKILFLYIHPCSGHEAAARALKAAINIINPKITTEAVDSLLYTSPIISKVLSSIYSEVIRRTPQLWDFLYDNQGIVNATSNVRNMLSKLKLRKIEKLLNEYQPDLVCCTQAAPNILISAYKEQTGINLPLVAVATDYRAHSYWASPSTDLYIVAATQTKEDLLNLGIQEQKIKILGIPIDPKFSVSQDKISAKQRLKLNPWLPTILVMGGSQGLGPIDTIVRQLQEIRLPLQTIVVCGGNKKIHRKLKKKSFRYGSALRIMGYTYHIDKIMDACDLIITKPGGMTSSEALAKNLPIVISNPLPGQEEKNSEFLINNQVAIRVDEVSTFRSVIESLLRHPQKLETMKYNTKKIAKPLAALESAKVIMEFVY